MNKTDLRILKTMTPKETFAPPFSCCHWRLFLSSQAKGGAFNFGGTMRTVIMTLLLVGVLTSAQALEASWYSVKDLHSSGQWAITRGVMANGHQFSDDAYTCATRDYSLGSLLRITNLNSNRQVIVRVTDRINKRFKGKRIDLSKAAFAELSGKQGTKAGLLPIKAEVI